jgi:hypothetical protein
VERPAARTDLASMRMIAELAVARQLLGREALCQTLLLQVAPEGF